MSVLKFSNRLICGIFWIRYIPYLILSYTCEIIRHVFIRSSLRIGCLINILLLYTYLALLLGQPTTLCKTFTVRVKITSCDRLSPRGLICRVYCKNIIDVLYRLNENNRFVLLMMLVRFPLRKFFFCILLSWWGDGSQTRQFWNSVPFRY